MGRGGAAYLTYIGTVLLATVSSASAGLWDVDIDLDPAPSPQDGPPFSAHATRNRAILPYQIIAIVGAYLGTVLIASTLLFTVGRKLRKHAQEMAERPTEMVKPMYRAFEASPVSPRSFSRWGQKLRMKTSQAGSMRSGTSEIGSPGGESVISLDPQALKVHRERDDIQMQNLYDHVYAFEEQRSLQDMPITEVSQASPPQYSRTRPPSLSGSRPDLQRVQTSNSLPKSPYGPTTPRSPGVRVIYPPIPEYDNGSSRDLYQGRALGEHTERRTGSGSALNNNKGIETRPDSEPGNLRKGILRKSIRDLKISAPIQKLRDDNSDGARTPLSPRYYVDPPTPPAPPTVRTLGSQYPSPDPGTAASATFSVMQEYENEQIDEIRALPQTYPQRGNSIPYDEQDTNRGGLQRESPNKRSAANVNNTLPFRQNNYTQQQNAFPTSPAGDWNFHVPRSPGPMSPAMKSPAIRERVLEISNTRLGVPLTAGCATPYSPYMPYTPITPITPHLQTRAERKQREREERVTRGAITEEEQVADEKDIWESVY